ncbi:hypothetical protein [Sphingomonas montana]|uniref:hypothetical protein n=1 Tax=Sphingomonas montana TaxID=1843236 RepID=UPI00096FA677|nr:hypothetical protein [Sphingomonas montana]
MTWTDFKHQYDAQGREKADGYSASHFDGMTEDERSLARTMMLDRALNGDTIDLNGLGYIGNADTVAALCAAAVQIAGLGWRHDILRHEVLFKLTGEPHYLTDLARYLDQPDRASQENAASVLTWYVLPRDIEPFLLERICDGRHDPAILPLLQA